MMYALIAVALVAAGITVGVMAVICLAIRRDDKGGRLTGHPGGISGVARDACGLRIRLPD